MVHDDEADQQEAEDRVDVVLEGVLVLVVEDGVQGEQEAEDQYGDASTLKKNIYI